jgi:hypothetical protein
MWRRCGQSPLRCAVGEASPGAESVCNARVAVVRCVKCIANLRATPFASEHFVKNQRKVRPRHTPWCMPSSVARSCALLRSFASRFPLPLALLGGSSRSTAASTLTPRPFNCMPSENAHIADFKPRDADHLTTPRRIGDCDANGRRLMQPRRRLLRGHRRRAGGPRGASWRGRG